MHVRHTTPANGYGHSAAGHNPNGGCRTSKQDRLQDRNGGYRDWECTCPLPGGRRELPNAAHLGTRTPPQQGDLAVQVRGERAGDVRFYAGGYLLLAYLKNLGTPHDKEPVLVLAVDIVLLTIRREQLHVLLINRSVPKAGQLALPGGFVLPDEDLPGAALRELRDETSLQVDVRHLEQLQTYGYPGRDPRGRVVSVAYLAITPDIPEPRAGTDAIGASWHPVRRLLVCRERGTLTSGYGWRTMVYAVDCEGGGSAARS